MLPINLDGNKYHFASANIVYFFIRSKLKCKPHENRACVFLMWIS